jgi:hypothetical protein
VPISPALGLSIAAVVVVAMGTAASLDQSIKQLPARRRIGALAYSDYSLAADAHNAFFWYGPLVAAWIIIVLGSAVVGWSDHPSDQRALALAATVVGVVGHFFVTGVFAAPALISQRKVVGDEAALARVFNRFERWQAVRAAIDVLTLAATVWVLVVTISGA